jgi:RimJ/RimL family protein N-acetyltransferase
VTDPFVPFTTARLTVRALRLDDAEALTAYRNDPDVARYQDWALPYPLERARQVIRDSHHPGNRPAAGEGWQLAVDLDGRLIGDVYLGLDATGSVATLGYTLAAAHHGAGYALEAVGAVVDRVLAERPQVHRIVASADPSNLPSIRLLEALGFSAEGVARRSEPIRGEWLDDARFGLLRDERAAWLARPSGPPDDVRLVEVTDGNVRAVGRLATFGWQRRLVAPNLVSLAEALVSGLDDAGGRLVPWCRAVEADGELVGFVMLAEPTATMPDAFLWRLMIDRWHQRRGIGQRVLNLVVEQTLAWGAPGLLVGWEPGLGSPEPFYVRNGFVPTGEVIDEEIFGRLTLAPSRCAP